MATEISSSDFCVQDASPALTSAAASVSNNGTRLGTGDTELRIREALTLWLRWNEAYEQATSRLFAAGQSAEKIEDFMDSLDQLRREAISLSHSLLD